MSSTAFWILAGAGLLVMATTAGLPSIPTRWAGLRNLHPQVQARFLALFKAIEALGYDVIMTSGHRSADTPPSYHYFGLAQDVNIIHRRTKQQYGLKAGRTSKAEWEATGVPALIRRMGFRWGGDFTMPVSDHYPHGIDPVHIDLGGRYPIAPLRVLATQMATAQGKTLAQFDGRTVRLAA